MTGHLLCKVWTPNLGSKQGLCLKKSLNLPKAHRQCLDPFKLPKILQDSSSHRIFRRMHGALNVGKK
jgi:hypothetical protein